MDGERGINAFAAGWDVSARRGGRDARHARDADARRAAGRDRARVQPHPERRHAAQRAHDRRARRHRVHRLDRRASSCAASRGSRDGKGGAGASLGLALFIIGYVGLFFARLIKSAVVAPARVPRRRLQRAVHAQPRRHRRRARPDQVVSRRHADRQPLRRGDVAHVLRPGGRSCGSAACSTPIRRSMSASGACTRASSAPSTAGGARSRRLPAAEAPDIKPTGRRASDIATPWGRTPKQSAALRRHPGRRQGRLRRAAARRAA